MPGIALTDHGVMYGVKEMFNYVNKKNGKLREQGLPEFKPIFGCEMYVTENGLETRLSGDRVITLSYWQKTNKATRISVSW